MSRSTHCRILHTVLNEVTLKMLRHCTRHLARSMNSHLKTGTGTAIFSKLVQVFTVPVSVFTEHFILCIIYHTRFISVLKLITFIICNTGYRVNLYVRTYVYSLQRNMLLLFLDVHLRVHNLYHSFITPTRRQ